MLGSPRWLLTPLIAAAAVIALASPAAAVSTEEKLSLLSSFTQTNTASYDAWNAARQNQPAWADYTLNWSTDYCSSSPDNPLGFDFALSCYRHDFGYRNLRLLERRYGRGALYWNHANRRTVDQRFRSDMLAHCAIRAPWLRTQCRWWAATYYTAVRLAGGP